MGSSILIDTLCAVYSVEAHFPAKTDLVLIASTTEPSLGNNSSANLET